MSAHKNAKDCAPTFDHSLVKENIHQLLHSGTRFCFKINKETKQDFKQSFPLSLSSLTLAFSGVGKHLLSRHTFALHNQGNDYITLNRAWGQTEATTTVVLAMTRQWHRAALQQAQLCKSEKEWGEMRNDKCRKEKSSQSTNREPGFRTTKGKESSQNKQIHYELRELEMPARSKWDFSHLFISIVFETTNKANYKMLPPFVLATAKSVQ